ncbi:MAG: hypothetical protein MI702_10870, partial [Chlorobiales bacterium]|nr:hypothetical protein [Chlorobiales bacterium]
QDLQRRAAPRGVDPGRVLVPQPVGAFRDDTIRVNAATEKTDRWGMGPFSSLAMMVVYTRFIPEITVRLRFGTEGNADRVHMVIGKNLCPIDRPGAGPTTKQYRPNYGHLL